MKKVLSSRDAANLTPEQYTELNDWLVEHNQTMGSVSAILVEDDMVTLSIVHRSTTASGRPSILSKREHVRVVPKRPLPADLPWMVLAA